MKPILVLGPDARWCVEVRRIILADDAVADPAAYSAVIVINDDGAGTVTRFLTACEMRRGREDLPIGVLSYPDEEGRAFTPMQLEPRLRLELGEEAVRVEYQA